MKSFFPYKDRFNYSQKSKIVFKLASCWDCDTFYTDRTKIKLHDRKTDASSVADPADHSTSTGHNIKWDHFEILASGQCDLQ